MINAERRFEHGEMREAWLNGEPLAQIDTGSPEVVTYLHTDHLATPRFGTNAAGSTVWTWDSGAFGKEAATGSATVNLRFPGQYYDAEAGLHYNWNRYYNPATGRYVSSDPIGLAGGLATYTYVSASPIMFYDPRGLADTDYFDPTCATITEENKGRCVYEWEEDGENKKITRLGKEQQKAFNDPDCYTVAGHGKAGIISDQRKGSWETDTPVPITEDSDLIKNIQNSEKYQKSGCVIFFVCESDTAPEGGKSVVQQTKDILGQDKNIRGVNGILGSSVDGKSLGDIDLETGSVTPFP